MERRQSLILQKMSELDKFKDYSTSIASDAGKINTAVDKMQQEVMDQLDGIIGGEA